VKKSKKNLYIRTEELGEVKHNREELELKRTIKVVAV
jgi:hypothetical protein